MTRHATFPLVLIFFAGILGPSPPSNLAPLFNVAISRDFRCSGLGALPLSLLDHGHEGPSSASSVVCSLLVVHSSPSMHVSGFRPFRLFLGISDAPIRRNSLVPSFSAYRVLKDFPSFSPWLFFVFSVGRKLLLSRLPLPGQTPIQFPQCLSFLSHQVEAPAFSLSGFLGTSRTCLQLWAVFSAPPSSPCALTRFRSNHLSQSTPFRVSDSLPFTWILDVVTYDACGEPTHIFVDLPPFW